MDEDILKLHMLTIAGLGFLMLVAGLVLYFFRDALSGDLRFLLPLPPIGVASYIFVFNMFRTYGGELPKGSMATFREAAIATIILAVVFFLFAVLNSYITDLLRRVF